ncbi:hypothetical protein [Lyngbya confervoides]|uniref:Uncharacterized protein n=1 Tax=Lyngbya confervoides BDU141951 TaxID=1574623 RepID=A0ABD4T4Q8_9CYAN|nr:hypothetical protein [Lyngbya confervoides]MCM1983634.1 hypothetical protein [Lyngbya confervoides BDU141951]
MAEDYAALIPVIDLLEGLEALMDQAPSVEIEQILQAAWLQVSETFPEDFLAATCADAGAAGLRRYLRVKAFFDNPSQHPIQGAELADYYHHRLPLAEERVDFFFPNSPDIKDKR